MDIPALLLVCIASIGDLIHIFIALSFVKLTGLFISYGGPL